MLISAPSSCILYASDLLFSMINGRNDLNLLLSPRLVPVLHPQPLLFNPSGLGLWKGQTAAHRCYQGLNKAMSINLEFGSIKSKMCNRAMIQLQSTRLVLLPILRCECLLSLDFACPFHLLFSAMTYTSGFCAPATVRGWKLDMP